MRTIKPFFLAILIFSASGTVYSQSSINAPDYFKKIRSSILSGLPASFNCRILGTSINNKLNSIPKDSWLDNSTPPTAILSYSKFNGIKIEVKNVDDLYRDLYKDLPRQIFAFEIILSSQDNESFISKYVITFNNPDTNGPVIIKLKVKSAENNLLLYVNPGTEMISRIDYNLGDELVSSSVITYDTIPLNKVDYTFPDKIVTSFPEGVNKETPDEIELNNFSLGSSPQ